MSKKNIFKSKKIIKYLFGMFAVVPVVTGFAINADSNVNNNYSISQNLQAFSENQQIPGFRVDNSNAHEGYTLLRLLTTSNDSQEAVDSGIGIKIPNFSVTDKESQENAKNILSIYNSLPSNIVTMGEESNIENIIWIDNTKWNTTDANNKYKIFNLGSTSTYSNYYLNNPNSSDESSSLPKSFKDYNITTKSQLPAFNQRTLTDESGNTTTENVSEEFLDANGVLALQITVSQINTTATSTQWESYYVLIPGFGGNLSNNALSNNPMLPSGLYTSGVEAVSNKDLNSFLDASWEKNATLIVPKISLVSRNNDASSGILSFVSSFDFDLPADIQFSPSFQGVTNTDISNLESATGKNVNVTNNNTYLSKINYDMNFRISGFQPSPAVSDIQVFIIVIVIIVSAVAISILAFGVTTVSRKIRFKNKM